MELPKKGQMGVEDLSDRMTRTNVVNALIDGLLLFCDYESSRNYSHQVTCDSGPPELEFMGHICSLVPGPEKTIYSLWNKAMFCLDCIDATSFVSFQFMEAGRDLIVYTSHQNQAFQDWPLLNPAKNS